MYKVIVVSMFSLLVASCYSVKWSETSVSNQVFPPETVIEIFQQYPNNVMSLSANAPGGLYKYDIGEKDSLYNAKDGALMFATVNLKLHRQTPKNKILADFTFIDAKNNQVQVNNVDLLRFIPKFDTEGMMNYPEMINEEYNRFGYVFRKEHDEFSIHLSEDTTNEKVIAASKRTYRCKITNNCLSPTKWEFDLVSENYSDFKDRLKSTTNLNQNKIVSHSWFYMDKKLYTVLMKIKNPNLIVDVNTTYNELSNKAEQVAIQFEKLRNPVSSIVNTNIVELGFKSKRKIVPLDTEQYYKKKFQLLLKGNDETYASILESPVATTQFKNEGYYFEESPKEFNLKWMQHLDSVYIKSLDVDKSSTYVEIELTGQWAPYKINIGNVDLAQLSEQKLHGMLFGFNTYPKTRRYNPKQNTIIYDADLLPKNIKPYVLLTQKKSHKWVNNQYKGVEKVYLTYDSVEQDVLNIYVLSYERITPVWMVKVKLPKSMRERVRIRKQLYNY